MNVLVPDLKAIGLDEVIYNREMVLSSVRSMPIQMKSSCYRLYCAYGYSRLQRGKY